MQIDARPRRQHAPSGKQSGVARDHDALDFEFAPEFCRMHRAAAAADHHGQIARIVTALDGDELQRIDHVGFGKTDDRLRRGNNRQAEARRQLAQTPQTDNSGSSLIRPPANRCGSTIPVSTAASVTVGSLPPRR